MTDIYLTSSLSTHNGDDTPQNHFFFEIIHCAVFKGQMKLRCFRARIDLILRKNLKKHLPFPDREVCPKP